MPDVRYWPPARRVLLWLSSAISWWPWAESRLLDYLYPSDSTYRFGGGDE